MGWLLCLGIYGFPFVVESIGIAIFQSTSIAAPALPSANRARVFDQTIKPKKQLKYRL
jgi:hypothetical protein